jgi:hypothetical protein
VGVRAGGWKQKPAFRIVSVKQARLETGLTVAQLVELPGSELLTRMLADGREEAAIRLRVEPVTEDTSGR